LKGSISDKSTGQRAIFVKKSSKVRVILFAVTEFLGIGSQVPLLLVIDAI
jgi:hypothetical protein